MRLADFFYGVKDKLGSLPDLPRAVFGLIFLFLAGVGALLLVRLWSMEQGRKSTLEITRGTVVAEQVSGVGDSSFSASGNMQGMYIASKTGTAYYLPWCGGVKLIHEENKVWFQSKEEATAKGYKPASNCKGI